MLKFKLHVLIAATPIYIYNFKDTKVKFCRADVAVWYNKICKNNKSLLNIYT